MKMFDPSLQLPCPGLFITATDTGVGKTVTTCAIAAALRRQQPNWTIGVSKPYSSGCRLDREGLVNEDTEALAHFANSRQSLDVINPIRFRQPLAPAVAAEAKGKTIDLDALRRSFETIAKASDMLLVEGAGGLLVPIDPDNPRVTMLDLAKALGYPVLVVARSLLGTLNHTALTVDKLQRSGLTVAGVVMNGHDGDLTQSDPSIATNRQWIEKMTGVKVLQVIPKMKSEQVQPARAVLDEAIVDLMASVDWVGYAGPSRV